jgi:serralysin
MNEKANIVIPKICFDRVVPDSYRASRAATEKIIVETAMRTFQANTPRDVLKDLDPNEPIHPVRMAMIVRKKWETGSTLKCRFLDGTSIQQERVVDKARIWEDYANIKIDFVTTTDEQVRISFSADPGSWSAVGTDALVTSYFPKYLPTMNYGWLKDDTEDNEYERVVVHEFGHALGCIHEHQSPNETLNWNLDAVYKYFSGPPNYWSKEEIDHNVLQKYSPQGIEATVFDPESIMLYQFPAALFQDGQGTPLNTHLSANDEKLIAQMYPK